MLSKDKSRRLCNVKFSLTVTEDYRPYRETDLFNFAIIRYFFGFITEFITMKSPWLWSWDSGNRFGNENKTLIE